MANLVTPKQYKEILSDNLDTPIGINTVYEIIHRKSFPSVRIGRRFYIDLDSAEKWMESMVKSRK